MQHVGSPLYAKAFHKISRRLADHGRKETMEVELGETRFPRKALQRELYMEVLRDIENNGVQPSSILVCCVTRPDPAQSVFQCSQPHCDAGGN